MFQYHYLGPDDWVDAGRKQSKFQDGPKLCIYVLKTSHIFGDFQNEFQPYV